jgi:TPR repeat protein
MHTKLLLRLAPSLLALAFGLAHANENDTAFAAYSNGDTAQAAERYRKLAQGGNPLAEFNYAMMLKRGEIPGDNADWREWLRKSADHGVMNAAYLLGVAYENGEGLPRSQTDATHWFQVAATKGHVQAQVSLATQYFLGRGAPQDDTQAAHWYEKAAEGGDVGAQYLIASMYEHGEGVAKDKAQAVNWYAAAARQGDKVAMIKAQTLANEK